MPKLNHQPVVLGYYLTADDNQTVRFSPISCLKIVSSYDNPFPMILSNKKSFRLAAIGPTPCCIASTPWMQRLIQTDFSSTRLGVLKAKSRCISKKFNAKISRKTFGIHSRASHVASHGCTFTRASIAKAARISRKIPFLGQKDTPNLERMLC